MRWTNGGNSLSGWDNSRPDGIVPIVAAFDLLGRRLFPKRWSAGHVHAALPGRSDIRRSDPKLHREAWHVLIALAQHARDGDLPVVPCTDATAPSFHPSEISMLYPLPRPGKPGQVELIEGDMFEARVNVTGFHEVLRREYPRKKSNAGRALAHPIYYQAAIVYWLANEGKPDPGKVRDHLRLVNPEIETGVPIATQYRYIENARKQVRAID